MNTFKTNHWVFQLLKTVHCPWFRKTLRHNRLCWSLFS